MSGNNVECKKDFLETLKNVHPNVSISERDDMLIGMAINHAYLYIRTPKCKCGRPLKTNDEQFTNQCSVCQKEQSGPYCAISNG